MKTIYLIGGTMGVGKTTTCQLLKKQLPNAVFLDGDWCWDADPFQVTEETKKMVMRNICFILNNFIHCSTYENIIFCWVMHEQQIIDELKAGIDSENCIVNTISLVCDENALMLRLRKDIDNGLREPDILERSRKRISLYHKLDSIKVDTSEKSPVEVINEIMNRN